VVLPHLRGVVVDGVYRDGRGVVIQASGTARMVACPDCGTASGAVHGRYSRRLVDDSAGGQSVVIELLVRRFRCRQGGCRRATFAEQFVGLTTPHARYSPPARETLTAVAVALAGRAGARLARKLGVRVGRDTMLKLLRLVPESIPGDVTVLGVDDFSLRRGHVYCTILLDMQTRVPVGVLEGRDAEPLAAWLKDHPGVQIICRDRAGAYAEGARIGAPEAIQVADRWHLWHNLGKAVDKTVTAHHSCVRAHLAGAQPAEPQPNEVPVPHVDDVPVPNGDMLDVCGRERPLVIRTQQRHTQIQQLVAEGLSLSAIGRQLELDRTTVRRFARAASIDELLTKAINRVSELDRFTEHLTTRFHAGVVDTATLHAEIQAQGYPGSVQTVRRYLRPMRELSPRTTTTAARPVVPKPRLITRWMMTDPSRLTADETVALNDVLAACPELAAAARHVRDFADLMHKRRGERIHHWMKAVTVDDLPAMHSLVTGLRRDLAAVIAGLTMTWSSGAVEGTVNKIKNLKRQMYGRAGFPLLRTRILLNT
jgi:transposase